MTRHIAQFAFLLTTSAAVVAQLPQKFGDFNVVELRTSAADPADRELLEEYGIRERFGAKFADSENRSMVVDAYRFSDTVGAHAAFLALRPKQGVSPMIWKIDAVTGGGATVMEYHNYVLRFSGALPTVSSALEETLKTLPGLTNDEKPWDLDGRYLDVSSTRMVLGPVSLARFARQIPPSIAAFRLGAKGRVANFETPSGRMSAIVVEYSNETIARERLTAFEGLPRTVARVDRTCVGAVFDQLETKAAQELLASYFCGPVTVSFDDANDWDGTMTLSEGIAWVLAAGVLGAGIAVVRRATSNAGKPPD